MHMLLYAENGPVYRLPISTWAPIIIVHDPTVARIIMEGDPAHGIIESEKSPRYSTIEKMTVGVPTMLTKKTFTGNWEATRKAVAPSFSMINLCKALPELQVKLNQFNDILDRHIAQGKQLIDLSSWMIRITIDFLSTSMFDTDFHTLEKLSSENGLIDDADDNSSSTETESDGQVFIRNVRIVAREFVMKGALAPMRKYKFWDKQIMHDVKEADLACRAIAKISEKVLNNYRNKYTKEELETDKSILAHLIRRYVIMEIFRGVVIARFFDNYMHVVKCQ